MEMPPRARSSQPSGGFISVCLIIQFTRIFSLKTANTSSSPSQFEVWCAATMTYLSMSGTLPTTCQPNSAINAPAIFDQSVLMRVSLNNPLPEQACGKFNGNLCRLVFAVKNGINLDNIE